MYKMFFLFLFTSCAIKPLKHTGTKPVSHAEWSALLARHVDAQGRMDYAAMRKDSARLLRYLSLLASAHPDADTWSHPEQLAYWINAYNAFTVKLILDHYPVKSIKDVKRGIPFVNSVWDIKFIQIGTKCYDLNNIEHGILRKYFDEPRIHFAINCASVSCPVLSSEAYTADHIEEQLDRAAYRFVNDPQRNILKNDHISISKIFKWFKGDFTKSGDLRSFIQQFSEIKINRNAKIDYLDYDWRLNDVKK